MIPGWNRHLPVKASTGRGGGQHCSTPHPCGGRNLWRPRESQTPQSRQADFQAGKKRREGNTLEQNLLLSLHEGPLLTQISSSVWRVRLQRMTKEGGTQQTLSHSNTQRSGTTVRRFKVGMACWTLACGMWSCVRGGNCICNCEEVCWALEIIFNGNF